MNKFTFKLNIGGVQELRKSPELVSMMESMAKTGINNVANLDDYKIDTHYGKSRANVAISAKTKKGERDNLDNNILLKALGSSKR